MRWAVVALVRIGMRVESAHYTQVIAD